MSFNIGEINSAVLLDDSNFRQTLNNLPQQAESSFSKVAALAGKFLSAAAIFGTFQSGFTGTRKFEKELHNLASLSDEISIDKFRAEILKVDASLGDSASLANAAYFAYSSGIRANEAELAQFVATIARGAKAAGAQVTPVMDALTTLMNAYGKSTSDASEMTDWFFNVVNYGKTTGEELAHSLGMIVGSAASANVSMNDLGAAVSTLTTVMPTAQSISALNQVIAGIVKPTAQVKKIMADFGVELSASAIQSKSLVGVLSDVQNAMKKYAEQGGNATEMMTQLFTSTEAIRAVSVLTGSQFETYNQVLSQFQNSTGSAAKAAEEQLKGLDAQTLAFVITLQKDLLTAIKPATDAINSLLEWYNKLSESGRKSSFSMLSMATTILLMRSKIGKSLNEKLSSVDLGGANIRAKADADAFAAAENQKRLALMSTEAQEEANHKERLRRSAELQVMNAKNATLNVANSPAFKNAGSQAQQQMLYNADMGLYNAKKQLVAATSAEAAAKARVIAINNQVVAANVMVTNTLTTQKLATTALGRAQIVLTAGIKKSAVAMKGFFASMGPIGLFMLAFQGIGAIFNWMDNKQQKALDNAKKLAEKSEETLNKGDADRKKDLETLTYLEDLSKKQKLSNQETQLASKYIDDLSGKYGEFGATLDKTTGKLTLASDARSKLAEAMKEQQDKEIDNAINEQKTLIRNLENSKAKGIGGAIVQNAKWVFTLGTALEASDYENKIDSDIYNIEQKIEALEARRNVNALAATEKTAQEALEATKRATAEVDKIFEKQWQFKFDSSGFDTQIKMLEDKLSRAQNEFTGKSKDLVDLDENEARQYQNIMDLQKQISDIQAARKKSELDLIKATEDARYNDLDSAQKLLSIESQITKKSSELNASAQNKKYSDYTQDELALSREIFQLDQKRLAIKKDSERYIEKEKQAYQDYLDNLAEEQNQKAEDKKLADLEKLNRKDARDYLQKQLDQTKQDIAAVTAFYQKTLSDVSSDSIVTADEQKRVEAARKSIEKQVAKSSKLEDKLSGMLDDDQKSKSLAGSFSSLVLNAQLGSNSPQIQIAQNTKRTNDLLLKIKDSGGLTW